MAIGRLAAVLALALTACGTAQAQGLYEDWSGSDGVITAERLPPDGQWQMTSGTLYRQGNQGWTGWPDDANGSAVFRMVSVQRDFTDYTLNATLLVDDMVTTGRTPAQDYDGVHVWVGYQSPQALYAVSVDRRDDTMVIKKKCAGGDSDGGTYYDLTPLVPAPVVQDHWQHVSVRVENLPDGRVAIMADRDGHYVEAVDDGVGCAPYRSGGVGIRGDNVEMHMGRIGVTPS